MATQRERQLKAVWINTSTELHNMAQDYEHTLKKYQDFFLDVGSLIDTDWSSVNDLKRAITQAMARSHKRSFTAPLKPSGKLI